MGRYDDMIKPGDVFGRLTVMERLGKASSGRYKWRCKCACGKESTPQSRPLVRGEAKSCGCLRKDIEHRMGFGFSPKEPRRRDKHVAMTKCGNCTQNFDPAVGGVVAIEKGRIAAGVCGDCIEDAVKIKLVLSREEVGRFAYDQYSCLETRRAAG